MLAIQPQYLPLSKLLNDRLFRIPEYQRAYSWTTHQRQDLFSDIEKMHIKSSAEESATEGHFMAAIVCLRGKSKTLGTDVYHVMDVVDGQQRLTTLIILLKAIALELEEENRSEDKLRRELEELLVKTEGGELLLLQTNHDTSHYFANYLRKGISIPSSNAKSLADREILQAIEECSSFIRKWQEEGKTLLSMATLLKNHLFFLLHEIDEESTVYTVFEVLNSRGLAVSWLDRLKSMLMGAAFELKKANVEGVIKDLHNIWRDIYSVIGLRQGMSTEALRFAATLRANQAPSRPYGAEDAVDIFISGATNAKAIRETANWLLEVTKAYDVVMQNSRVNAVTRISQARLLATAIHLSDLKSTEKDAILTVWEKVTFRIYGMSGRDARTRVGDYIRLAWRLVNESLSAKEVKAEIITIGEEFTIEAAVNQLRNTNCYEGWEAELRYLMFRYEEHLAKAQGIKFSNEQWEKIWMVSPSNSIEHIWPQSKAPEKQKHRLGNLVILTPHLNSTLQDINPKDKTEAYRKTGLLIAGEVADMLEEGSWNKKAIDAREEEILAWAETEWGD